MTDLETITQLFQVTLARLEAVERKSTPETSGIGQRTAVRGSGLRLMAGTLEDLEDILNKSQVAAVLKTAYDQVRLIQQAFNQRAG